MGADQQHGRDLSHGGPAGDLPAGPSYVLRELPMDTPGKITVRYRSGETETFEHATATPVHSALVIRTGTGRTAKQTGIPMDLVLSWEHESPTVPPAPRPPLPGGLR